MYFYSRCPIGLLKSEFSYFKLHPLLFNSAHTACIIPIEKHWPIQWDTLKQPHMSLRSPCPVASVSLKGIKPSSTGLWSSGTAFFGVMKLLSVLSGWAGVSRTDHTTSAPDLTNAFVAEHNQILTAISKSRCLQTCSAFLSSGIILLYWTGICFTSSTLLGTPHCI